MIRFTHKGNFEKTNKFLEKAKQKKYFNNLDRYGKAGVEALSAATPVRTGKTADSWSYEIQTTPESVSIVWSNSNVNQNVNIAMLIQLGHGTGTGGYVQGIDYINPTMKPIFDEILEKVWKEVTA